MKGGVPARLNQSRRHLRVRVAASAVAIAVLFTTVIHPAAAQTAAPAPPLPPLNGPSLVTELGCVLCHTDLPGQSTLREQTPDLGSAGLRYRTAYLFDFLLQPRQVRRHLGRARMPAFHLHQKEALALALFLESQKGAPSGWPELPSPLREHLDDPPLAVAKAEFDQELSQGLACLTCHTLDGQGGNLGPELATVGHQLHPGWIKTYLVAPARFGVPPPIMPAQFYQLDATRSHFEELVPRAAERILTIVDHLTSRGAAKTLELETKWKQARQQHPNVTPADGENLFRAFNCAACHRHPTLRPRPDHPAPELVGEGARAQPSWLIAYLKSPHAIRPAGHQSGDGARMPDFRLRDDEANTLAQFLGAQVKDADKLLSPFQPRPLSAFSRNKAQTLLETKLSCLGCHQLGGTGGRLGPDLSAVGGRLQPAYIFGIIESPRRIAPHSIMPNILLTRPTVELLANHLLQGGWTATNTGYLSPLEHRLTLGPQPSATDRSAASNYRRFCAPCHGPDGRGDGFNAAFLKARPTVHADAGYMSRRPDDTLFDGIYSGGSILNRSPLMPLWGGTLGPREIRDLVQHLRRLCQCEGPEWSRDNSSSP